MSQVPLTPLFPTPPQNGYNNDHLPPLRPTPIKFINDNSYSHSNSHHNHNHHHYHQLHPQLNSVNNITTTHKQFNTNLTPSYSKNTPTTYSQTQSRLSTSNSTYIRYHSPIEPEITPSSTPLQLGNTHSISQISEDNYNQYNPFLRSNRNSKIYLGNNPQPEIHGHNIRINTPELPPELPPTVTTSSMSGHSIYSPESIRSAPITSDPPKFNANQVNTNEYNYNNNKPHSRSTFSLQFHSQKNKRKRKQPHNTTLRTRALSAQPPIKHQHQHQKTQLRNVQSNQGGQVLNVLNTLNLRDTYSGSGSISVSQSKSNEYTNSNSFMVFQPNQSNNSHDEIDVLDRIGLSDFKQNEYVEMDMPSHKPQLQRAGTAPNHTKINSHNNPYTNTYGFNMNKIERRKHNQKQVQSQYHRYNLHSSKQIQLQSQSHGQSHQRHATYNSIQHQMYANPQQQQQHVPPSLQHNYHSNPAPQQPIYMNYHSQQQIQTNNNYNVSLDAQIRAHHTSNDMHMDSDEGTESESDSSSDTNTDFIDSENSDSDTISNSESHSDSDSISTIATDSKINSNIKHRQDSHNQK